MLGEAAGRGYRIEQGHAMTRNARNTDPQTSKDAAPTESGLTKLMCELLQWASLQPDGFIRHDIPIGVAGRDHGMRRISDCVDRGLLVDTGKTRVGPYRRECAVYVITPTAITRAITSYDEPIPFELTS